MITIILYSPTFKISIQNANKLGILSYRDFDDFVQNNIIFFHVIHYYIVAVIITIILLYFYC